MRRIFHLLAVGLITQWFPSFSYAQEKKRKIVEEKPTLSTNQGGFSFDYGMALGKDCKIVKLHNHPGRLRTPVKWASPKEIFIDTTLVECPSSGNCDWVNVKIPAWNTYSDKTTLGYGVNRDQYQQDPEAYCNGQRQAASPIPLITSISGPISDAKGDPIVVGVEVSCTVIPNAIKKVFQLRYVIAALQNGVSFQVGSSQSSAQGSSMTLLWESAESSEFLQELKRAEVKRVDSERTLVIEVSAPAIEVESKPLTLIQSGQAIFTTTAPAYRPKEE